MAAGSRARTAGRPLLIRDGERAKTLATAERLYDEFARRGLDRASTVIAFGGGVVGDVAGFAAATYLRGVRLVQVPTTLLSQVDSAIGGKTGVNLRAGKNLVGAFHPPALVVCDPAVLRTLPAREFQSGLYEVLKYGIIASRPLFDRVTSRLDALFGHDLAGAHARHRGVLPHQGESRHRGRAGIRTPPHSELRTHGRSCPRGADSLSTLPPRRSHRARHAGRPLALGRARNDVA